MLGLTSISPHPNLRELSVRNYISTPSTRVVQHLRIALSIEHHNISLPSANTIPEKMTWVSRHTVHVRLAVSTALRAVISSPRSIKESPCCRVVKKKFTTAIDILAEGSATLSISTTAPAEVWVSVLGVGDPWCWSQKCCTRTLVVWGLSLHEAGEDVLGGVEVVIVEPVVLRSGADQPGSLGRLDENTTTGGDDGVSGTTIQVVVCGPDPDVLDVCRRGRGQVDCKESGHTATGILVCAGVADGGLGCTAHGYLSVPDSDIAWGSTGYVDLDDDSTWKGLGDGESHIGNVGDADVAGVTDLDDWGWGVDVLEGVAGSGNDGPGFTDDAGVGGDEEGALDDVDTVWEVCNLALVGSHLENSIQRW